MKHNNNIGYISNELLKELSATDSEALDQWRTSQPDNEKFRQLINSIELSTQVLNRRESLRESIKYDLNRRIDRNVRRQYRLKVACIAASIAILVGITGFLSFQQGYKQQSSQLVRLENPHGLRATVFLPDGTKVTLNSGTTLLYPIAFITENRTVELIGEAFFEVTHDTDRHFVVKAGDMNIKVFGTKFNVKGYNNEDQTEVTLTEGSIGAYLGNESEILRIQPGQQIRYDRQKKQMTTHVINTNQATGWKEGKYYFNNMHLEEITKQLERDFNVQIQVAERLKTLVITVDFVRGEDLNQMLEVMTSDRRMKYSIAGNQVYINER